MAYCSRSTKREHRRSQPTDTYPQVFSFYFRLLPLFVVQSPLGCSIRAKLQIRHTCFNYQSNEQTSPLLRLFGSDYETLEQDAVGICSNSCDFRRLRATDGLRPPASTRCRGTGS
jgi:hypothetical protein